MVKSSITETLAERLSASAIAKELNVNPCVPNRWMTSGLCGHKLDSFFIGGRRYTTKQLLDDFLQRVNAAKSAAASAQTDQVKSVQAKVSGRTDRRARDYGKLVEAHGG